MALEHELIARNNMIYPLFRWSGMKDKPTILTKYKNCEVYKTLDYMSDFDSTYFINKFYTEELLNYTNKFIKDVAKENNFCNTKQDLINYYKIWETFFKNTSIEYKEYGLKEIDKVVNDIRDDKIYEENSNFYGRLYGNKATTIFDNIYKSLFNI